MKSVYEVMLLISIVCLAGDSESFLLFLIWHIVWFAVMLFCFYKLDRLEGEEE
jgi:hypothetical protein